MVYFSAAELLANATKHSGARHVTLEAVDAPGLLRVRVTDDGRGGARPVPGGGLWGWPTGSAPWTAGWTSTARPAVPPW
jgi:signal transduction histidine kinase